MTTYTPKTKPQPAAANTGALPKELNDALAAAAPGGKEARP